MWTLRKAKLRRAINNAKVAAIAIINGKNVGPECEWSGASRQSGNDDSDSDDDRWDADEAWRRAYERHRGYERTYYTSPKFGQWKAGAHRTKNRKGTKKKKKVPNKPTFTEEEVDYFTDVQAHMYDMKQERYEIEAELIKQREKTEQELQQNRQRRMQEEFITHQQLQKTTKQKEKDRLREVQTAID